VLVERRRGGRPLLSPARRRCGEDSRCLARFAGALASLLP
jgi:hypothetical protein